MKSIFWLLALAFPVGAVWVFLHTRRKFQARERAEAERFAAFMAATAGAKKPADGSAAAPEPAPAPAVAAPAHADGLAQQKLLFDAAHKAGEAGEPALAIQLYARLLARYPATSFAGQVRPAVEAQKKKLAKT